MSEQLPGLQPGPLARWLAAWLTACLPHCLARWVEAWFAAWLAASRAGWLAWLAAWLAASWAGWLACLAVCQVAWLPLGFAYCLAAWRDDFGGRRGLGLNHASAERLAFRVFLGEGLETWGGRG